MGGLCGAEVSPELAQQLEVSRAIDAELREEGRKRAREAWILLSGPPKGGRNTMRRLLQHLFVAPMTEKERSVFRDDFGRTCFDLIRTMVRQTEEHDLCFDSQAEVEAAQSLVNICLPDHEKAASSVPPPPQLARQEIEARVAVFRNARAVKKLMAWSWTPYSAKAIAYWFDNSARFVQEDFVPCIDDLLHLRCPSTVLMETQLEHCFLNQVFNMKVLVPPRYWSNSQKWRQLFCGDEYSATVFLVSMEKRDHILPYHENVWDENCRVLTQTLLHSVHATTRVIVCGTHADCLSTKEDACQVMIDFVKRAVHQTGGVHFGLSREIVLIPDLCLTASGDITQKWRLQTLLEIACTGNAQSSLHQVRLRPVKLDQNNILHVYHHPSENHVSFWTLLLIWHFRRSSPVALLSKDLLGLIKKHVFA